MLQTHSKYIISGIVYECTIPFKTPIEDIAILAAEKLNGIARDQYNMVLKITADDILGKGRRHEAATVRFILIHIALHMGYLPYHISVNLNKHHSVIYNAVLRVKSHTDTKYPLFVSYYNLIAPEYGLTPIEP